MKHVLRKEFFREIRKSRNRYLSLLFIVALGVAFFSGVLLATLICYLVFAVIYLGVYLLTSRTYYRIVSRQNR